MTIKQTLAGTLTLLVMLLTGSDIRAQDAEEYFTLHFSGQSQEVAKLLARQPDRGVRNILFLVSPMACPRCEGIVYELMSQLRRQRINGSLLCVVSYPRVGGVIAWAQRRNFPVRTIADTAGILFGELGINQTPPFVTVWDSTGVLRYSKALYGVSSEDTLLWSAFLDTLSTVTPVPTKTAEQSVRHASSVGIDSLPAVWKTPVVIRRTALQEDSTCLLGRVGFLSFDPGRRSIAVTDHLSLTVSLFDLETGLRKLELAPDSALRRTFSANVSEVDFARYERRGIANSMLFGSWFRDDSTITVAASLPEFKQTLYPLADGGASRSLSYYNVAALVSFSTSTGRVRNVVRIDHAPESTISISHAASSPAVDPIAGNVAFPTLKGYPVVGMTSAIAVGDQDPTNPEFYTNVPLFRTFDLHSGERQGDLGLLDDLSRKLGIGYAIVSARVAFDEGISYVAQNPVPYIVTSDSRHIPLKSYFNEAIVDRPSSPDDLRSVDDLTYLADSTGGRIVQVTAGNGTLWVVWHVKRKGKPTGEGHEIVIQSYTLADGSLGGEWWIPRSGEDGSLSDTVVDPKTSSVHCIYQTSQATTYVQRLLR